MRNELPDPQKVLAEIELATLPSDDRSGEVCNATPQMAVSIDGRWLVVERSDDVANSYYVVDAESWSVRREFKLDFRADDGLLEFSRDEPRLLWPSGHSMLLPDGEMEPPSSTRLPTSWRCGGTLARVGIAYDDNGSHYTVRSAEGAARVVRDGGPGVVVRLSPDDRVFAVADQYEPLCELWALESGALWQSFTSLPDSPRCLAFSPDGRYLLIAFGSIDARGFEVREVATTRCVRQVWVDYQHGGAPTHRAITTEPVYAAVWAERFVAFLTVRLGRGNIQEALTLRVIECGEPGGNAIAINR